MTDKNTQVLKILEKHTKGKIDDQTWMNYMTEMIIDEGLQRNDNQKLFDLIAPFLIDFGCVSNESEASTLCHEILDDILSTEIPDSHTDKRSTDLDNDFCDENNSMQPSSMENLVESRNFNEKFVDPYLGLSEVQVNVNISTSIGEIMKKQKELQKERDKQIKLMKEWQKSKIPIPVLIKYHKSDQLSKINDIIVHKFSISIAGMELIKDAPLKLVRGRRYGLIGRNGIGKSTFLAALAKHEIPGIPSDISIGCVEQEIDWNNVTSFEAVLSVDVERKNLLEEENLLLHKEHSEKVGERLKWIYQRMIEIDASSAESSVNIILKGMGLSEEQMHTNVVELSGGWRMRVALSRALFADPDILLLDEPTNHLDLHAVAWLTNYLLNLEKTVIVVSHARDFLNEICTDIIHFVDKSFQYYRGNYDQFETMREEKQQLQQKQFDNQEMKRKHIQSFIDRFRYNSKRASLVQSRIKALNKLPLLEAVANDPTLTFTFSKPEPISPPILQIQSGYFTYQSDLYKRLRAESKSENYLKNSDEINWILKNLNISFDLDSRIAICGVNGSGKSTLLNILTGENELTDGMCFRSGKLRIGYFAQHHVDQLDLTLNAVQQLQYRYPDKNINDADARSFLGKFGISGLLALEPLYVLSGGQKSRVAIALIAYKKPHILILDEPTNHLYLDAVQALIVAIHEFEGGVIIVSHDTHFLSCVADEIWHVDPVKKTCEKLHLDINSYRKQILNEFKS